MVKTKKSATITQTNVEIANSTPAPENNAVTTPNKEKDHQHIHSKDKEAVAPPAAVEPDNTIYVHRSKQTENIPSMSPDCLALETYLRMRKIPYQYASEKIVDKQHGEPVVTLNHKDYVGFDKIVEALANVPPPPPVSAAVETTETQENGGDHPPPPPPQVQQPMVTLAELTTADQQSDCQAYVMSLADIVLAYCLYNQRIKNSAPADFITRIKSSYRNIKSVFTKKEKENKDEEDRLTKLKPEQIVDVVKDSLKALNNRMQRSGGVYFFGDELTKHDAILFGVLAQYWKEPPTSSANGGGGSQSTNDFLTITSLLEAEPDNRLVSYLENIKENFWPDWKERCAQPPPPPAPVTSPAKRGTFRKLRGDQSVTTPTDKTAAAVTTAADQSAKGVVPAGDQSEKIIGGPVQNGGETEKSVNNGEDKLGTNGDQPLTNGVTDGSSSPLVEKSATHLSEIPPISAE